MNIRTEVSLTNEDVLRALMEYVRSMGIEIDPKTDIRVQLYSSNGSLIAANDIYGQVTATLVSNVEP